MTATADNAGAVYSLLIHPRTVNFNAAVPCGGKDNVTAPLSISRRVCSHISSTARVCRGSFSGDISVFMYSLMTVNRAAERRRGLHYPERFARLDSLIGIAPVQEWMIVFRIRVLIERHNVGMLKDLLIVYVVIERRIVRNRQIGYMVIPSKFVIFQSPFFAANWFRQSYYVFSIKYHLHGICNTE